MTAQDVYDALGKKWPAGQYAILPQATQGTGFRANRWLDALVVSLWPSRGLSLQGIEIKISRGDWRRELRQPEKAEALFEFLDLFSVAAPKGIVDVDELPPTWGLLELDGGTLKETVKPKMLHGDGFKRPLSREFFAGLCRRLDETRLTGAIATAVSAAHAEATQKAEESLRRRLTIDESRRAGVSDLLNEAGCYYAEFVEDDWRRLGRLLKPLLEAGHPDGRYGLVSQFRGHAKTLEKVARDLEATLRGPITPSSEPDS